MFDNALTISAGLPAVLFLFAGLVPAVLADRRPRSMRAAVVGLAGVAVAAAVLSAALLAAGGPVDRTIGIAERNELERHAEEAGESERLHVRARRLEMAAKYLRSPERTGRSTAGQRVASGRESVRGRRSTDVV